MYIDLKERETLIWCLLYAPQQGSRLQPRWQVLWKVKEIEKKENMFPVLIAKYSILWLLIITDANPRMSKRTGICFWRKEIQFNWLSHAEQKSYQKSSCMLNNNKYIRSKFQTCNSPKSGSSSFFHYCCGVFFFSSYTLCYSHFIWFSISLQTWRLP